MIVFRSLAFAAAAFVWTGIAAVLFLPLLALPRRILQQGVRIWARGLMVLLAALCGLRFQVRGRQNIPAGAAVIAANHQSTWDTLVFHLLLDDPVFVLKKELLRVPVIGWYMRKTGNIGIDRSAGPRALRAMIPAVERALEDGRQVIVFPEGTRAAPDEQKPYQPGIAALYTHVRTPLVPVALNSGLFWGRRSVVKHPGVITLEVLPEVPKGLDRKAFLHELERRIREAADRLNRRGESPALVRRGAPAGSSEAGPPAGEEAKT